MLLHLVPLRHLDCQLLPLVLTQIGAEAATGGFTHHGGHQAHCTLLRPACCCIGRPDAKVCAFAYLGSSSCA